MLKDREQQSTLQMKRAILLLTLIWPLVGLPANAAQLGRYACKVEEVYGTDDLGKSWKHARFIYDADAGTLDGSLDLGGHLAKQGLELPPPNPNVFASEGGDGPFIS